jgi:carbohydrate-binding DOMON domain-containing protein
MQQKYYRADYGYFKSPALPGWGKYVQKVNKTRENE